MSRKLDASLKKIDDVFEQMDRKGITVSENKGGWSRNTLNVYGDMMKSLVKEIHNNFGIADLKKITPDQVKSVISSRVDSYFKGETKESFNVKTILSAVKAFNVGARETNVFKGKEVNLGDIDQLKAELKTSNFIRYTKSSSIIRANPEQCEKVLSNIKEGGYKTEMREIAYNVSKIAFETGGRITAVLRLRPQDIDFKKNEINYINDKGGLDRTVKIDQKTKEFLQRLVTDKKTNQMIFGTKNKDGTFKSVKETKKAVERIVSAAGKEFKTTEKIAVKDQNGKKRTIEVEKRFTPHSFRKGFSMKRTKEYYDRFSSKSAIKRYIAERIKENEKIKQKLNTYRKFINKDRKTPRELTREEYAIFFTSVDLGHYRLDVVNNYYTTMKETLAYFDK